MNYVAAKTLLSRKSVYEICILCLLENLLCSCAINCPCASESKGTRGLILIAKVLVHDEYLWASQNNALRKCLFFQLLSGLPSCEIKIDLVIVYA